MTDEQCLELERFVDGELAAADRDRVQLSLADPAIAAYVAELRRLKRLARNWQLSGIELPADPGSASTASTGAASASGTAGVSANESASETADTQEPSVEPSSVDDVSPATRRFANSVTAIAFTEIPPLSLSAKSIRRLNSSGQHSGSQGDDIPPGTNKPAARRPGWFGQSPSSDFRLGRTTQAQRRGRIFAATAVAAALMVGIFAGAFADRIWQRVLHGSLVANTGSSSTGLPSGLSSGTSPGGLSAVVASSWTSEYAARVVAGSVGKFRSVPTFTEILALELVNPRRDIGSQPGSSGASSAKLLGTGKALIIKEDWPAAIRVLERFLSRYSNDPAATESRLWLGYCLVRSGDAAKAVTVLKPFETAPVTDLWTDDGLLQLGRAYHSVGKHTEAVNCFKRLHEHFPESIWKTEALCSLINVLFYDREDFASCYKYCEELLKKPDSSDALWEHRYIGAYCLNTMRRFDDAEKWMNRWFDPRSAHEQAWRRLLVAQRKVLEGDAAPGIALAKELDEDFPDLDGEKRLEIVLRGAAMLRQAKQPAAARQLLVHALDHSDNFDNEHVGWILDELYALNGRNLEPFVNELTTLWNSADRSVSLKDAVRERLVEVLDAAGESERTRQVLQNWLANPDLSEVLRAPVAIVLADELNDTEAGSAAAVKLLESQLEKIERDDLRAELTELIDRYRNGSAEMDEEDEADESDNAEKNDEDENEAAAGHDEDAASGNEDAPDHDAESRNEPEADKEQEADTAPEASGEGKEPQSERESP